jgi:hypothetical protein
VDESNKTKTTPDSFSLTITLLTLFSRITTTSTIQMERNWSQRILSRNEAQVAGVEQRWQLTTETEYIAAVGIVEH